MTSKFTLNSLLKIRKSALKDLFFYCWQNKKRKIKKSLTAATQTLLTKISNHQNKNICKKRI